LRRDIRGPSVGGWEAPYAAQDLTTSTPMRAKSATLRVTSVRVFTRAVAAIRPSEAGEVRRPGDCDHVIDCQDIVGPGIAHPIGSSETVAQNLACLAPRSSQTEIKLH
jgi:hypothetical protein